MKNKFEKITKLMPAFHKVSENKGVGDVRCFMVLKGKKGAVGFVFGTGMYLPETYKYWEEKKLNNKINEPEYMGYDVGYHSLKPMYEGQYSKDNCEWLNEKRCYYEGTSLIAREWMDILVKQGSDKIWEMLEQFYKTTYEKH